MKKLLILLFSLLISFNSYGEWELIIEDDAADGYIDKETIKENNDYVYFWMLQNNNVPDESGIISTKAYVQGDCKIDRVKFLVGYGYKVPMAEGEIEDEEIPDNPQWRFTAPDSVGGNYLNYACDYVK